MAHRRLSAGRTSMSSSRTETGQGTLEYVGLVIVAALLVVAVVSAVGPQAGAVRSAIACHIRSITTQSGSCGADVPPTAFDAEAESAGGHRSSSTRAADRPAARVMQTRRVGTTPALAPPRPRTPRPSRRATTRSRTSSYQQFEDSFIRYDVAELGG